MVWERTAISCGNYVAPTFRHHGGGNGVPSSRCGYQWVSKRNTVIGGGMKAHASKPAIAPASMLLWPRIRSSGNFIHERRRLCRGRQLRWHRCPGRHGCLIGGRPARPACDLRQYDRDRHGGLIPRTSGFKNFIGTRLPGGCHRRRSTASSSSTERSTTRSVGRRGPATISFNGGAGVLIGSDVANGHGIDAGSGNSVLVTASSKTSTWYRLGPFGSVTPGRLRYWSTPQSFVTHHGISIDGVGTYHRVLNGITGEFLSHRVLLRSDTQRHRPRQEFLGAVSICSSCDQLHGGGAGGRGERRSRPQRSAL